MSKERVIILSYSKNLFRIYGLQNTWIFKKLVATRQNFITRISSGNLGGYI